jgi:hypothetical protein
MTQKYSIDLKEKQTHGCEKYSNESGSGNFLDQLSDHQLLNKNSAPRSCIGILRYVQPTLNATHATAITAISTKQVSVEQVCVFDTASTLQRLMSAKRNLPAK